MLKHLGHGETDVLGDLAQKNRRSIAASVKWNRCIAAGGVTKLLVRTALPHFGEAQFAQDRYDFGRLENRDITHDSGDRNVLYSNKLRLEDRFSVFEQH